MRSPGCVVAVVALSACTEGGVELGQIVYDNDVPRVVVARTATVDQPIELRVTTYGGGCVDIEGTAVEQTTDHVEVSPLVTRPDPDAECTRDLRYLEHLAVFAFTSPGMKTVEVLGRGTMGVTLRLPYSIEVSP